ncbi:MAG: hypothetical protein GF411_08850 [Candidatus Lokiarchaeota archaeon]|nr:hypothetical protein [Candidatus Lokiarchaeota archaeon]
MNGDVEQYQSADDDSIDSLDDFSEHKIDLSKEVADKDDKEVIDYILSKDENELVPWESTVLPSEGIYYDGAIPGGVVQVRPMGIFAEKVLSTMRMARTGEALDKIFEKCVRYPNSDFDPMNLLVGDSTYLLFYLRGITFGNLYEFVVKCSNPECGHTMSRVFDLNTLAGTITKPQTSRGEEPFEVKLPYWSQTFGKDFKVKVRMIRRYDMKNIMTGRKVQNKLVNPTNVQPSSLSKKFRKVQSTQSINDLVEKNLNLVIVEAMGETDKSRIRQLVSRMHSTDTSTIRNFLDEVSPGIDTTVSVTCDECDQEMKVPLPVTESFFRRTVGGGVRE